MPSPSGRGPGVRGFGLKLETPSPRSGRKRKPPVTLQPGDTVRLEVTGLGVLENPIKDA